MAGIGGDNRVQIKTGETFIAASQRPDGSWRKERKVKTGYVPQDEQPKYESRGKQETEKGARFPIGLTPVQMQQKQTRKVETTTATGSKKGPVTAVVKPNAPITVRDHLEKKLEGLRKKLREIDTLQQRIDDGQLTTPEKTQLEKIERREEIVAMMASLELSLSE